jgi:hypothetical protein
MATHRQRHTNSTFVRPPRFHALPERPNVKAHLPPMHIKPRCICRNFIFWGHCREVHCPRAHVPFNAMIDLFEYLLERDDCPMGLPSVRARLTRPLTGGSRKGRLSDQICPDFLESDGYCEQSGCPRAHLSSIQIYSSLLPSAKPIEPKTSVVALVPNAGEDPVVKLPEKTNHTSRQASLVDNIPPPSMVVQLPAASFPDRKCTLTESDVLGPHQSLVLDPLPTVAVRLPKLTGPQRVSSPGSSATVRFFASTVNTIVFFDALSEQGTTRRQLEDSQALSGGLLGSQACGQRKHCR